MTDQLTPDHLIALYQTTLQQAYRDQEARWARARLYLVLLLAGLIATLALLKLEGTWYVDALIAAAFLAQGMCGLVFSTSLGRREPKPQQLLILEERLAFASAAEPSAATSDGRNYTLGAVVTALILLSILHFGACGLALWLTFFSPPEMPVVEEEAIVFSMPSAVGDRFCSRCGR